jgi:cytochrome c
MFDICAICANENGQGKCIHPGQTCDEAYDFVLKPIYQVAPEMYKALKRANQFITNGIEFGYIRMPDPDTEDTALETPGMIQQALAKAEGK